MRFDNLNVRNDEARALDIQNLEVLDGLSNSLWVGFEVFLEAFVLKPTWKVDFRSLFVFTRFANFFSLAACQQ